MTLQQLEFFISVAIHQSFTKAADALYTSQSTVSKQISALEDELGTELFIRQSNRVFLSPCGQLVLNESVRGLNHIRNVTNLVADNMSGCNGFLRVAYLGMEISRRLSDGLAAFTEHYPDILLNFISRSGLTTSALLDENAIGALLDENAADLVLRPYYPYELDNSTASHTLFESPCAFMVRKDHPCAHHPARFFQALERETVVLPLALESRILNAPDVEVFKKAGLPQPRVTYVPNLVTCQLYVHAGQGAIIVDAQADWDNSPNVALIPAPPGFPPIRCYAAWKPEDPNPAIRFFLNQFNA